MYGTVSILTTGRTSKLGRGPFAGLLLKLGTYVVGYIKPMIPANS